MREASEKPGCEGLGDNEYTPIPFPAGKHELDDAIEALEKWDKAHSKWFKQLMKKLKGEIEDGFVDMGKAIAILDEYGDQRETAACNLRKRLIDETRPRTPAGTGVIIADTTRPPPPPFDRGVD